MSDDIKLEVIKKTQESLSRYIKKPPLTEKLLKKPPFRFLHDIINNVIRETSFLEGVFTPEELNHENIKDRDGKINFLQKAIDAVKSITGTQLTARPSKIVAGHEPTKTNEFLQAIGKALEKKLDSSGYSAKPSKPEKTGKSKSTNKDLDSSGYTGKSTKQEKTGKAKSSNKDEGSKTKSKTSIQGKSQPRDKSKSKESTSTKKKSSQVPKPSKDTELEAPKAYNGVEATAVTESSNDDKVNKSEDEHKVISSPPQSSESFPEQESLPSKSDQSLPKEQQSHTIQSDEKDIKDDVQDEAAVDLNSMTPKKTSHERKKKSAKVTNGHVEIAKELHVADADRKEAGTPIEIGVFGSKTIGSPREPTTSDIIQESSSVQRITSARPRTARPASARPAAPRIRDRGEVVIQEEPRLPVGKVNVITDGDSMKEQDEYENFVVEETPLIASLDQVQESPAPSVLPIPGDEGQHGHLVAQILETQKELEDDSQFSFGEKQITNVGIEWETGQKREKEIASKEVDRLRASIQTLTRAANPLGKLMDFLQEDVDAMQRELELWKSTNEQLQGELLEEQSLTEESVEPMKIHLQHLQHGITEKLDEISALKATIQKNDIKIQKLVTGGLVQKSDIFA